jgi:thiol-disulfide isomerase/thioredoxin
MDCWATWCGPCVAEMPNSKLLMEEYKYKDVVFVFICLDSEEKNWKSVISKYSLPGQHFFLSKKQSNDFREVFGINGIPHYILFNKKGAIFENMTLPPGFVKEKIDKLLSEK